MFNHLPNTLKVFFFGHLKFFSESIFFFKSYKPVVRTECLNNYSTYLCNYGQNKIQRVFLENKYEAEHLYDYFNKDLQEVALSLPNLTDSIEF